MEKLRLPGVPRNCVHFSIAMSNIFRPLMELHLLFHLYRRISIGKHPLLLTNIHLMAILQNILIHSSINYFNVNINQQRHQAYNKRTTTTPNTRCRRGGDLFFLLGRRCEHLRDRVCNPGLVNNTRRTMMRATEYYCTLE